MKIAIRNYLGISALDLDLGGVTLIGGKNATGKSSAIEAVIGAATSSALARGLATKKAAGESVMRQGSDAGAVTLSGDGWARRVSYPGCDVQEKGSVPFLGSAAGIGAVRLGELRSADRVKLLTEKFGLEPREDDLVQAVLGLDAVEMADSDVGALWKRIEAAGWDAVAKTCREENAKLKGAWEHVTGTRYGVEKAAKWRPEILEPTETYGLADEALGLTNAQAQLESLLGRAGASDAERGILQCEAERATRLGLPAAAEALRKQIAEADQKLAGMREKLAAAQRDETQLTSLKCPHCEGLIRISSTANGNPVLVAASSRKAEDPLVLASRVQAIKDEGKKLLAMRTSDAESLASTERMVAASAAAAATLEALPAAAEAASPPAIEAARATIDAHQQRIGALKALAEATSLAKRIESATALLGLLEPSGLRADAVRRGLSAINEALSKHSIRAGWAMALITGEMDMLYNGRLYQLCSESERWRSDVTMTCALAEAEAAAVVVVDHLDILAPQDRGRAIKLLAQLGIASVVACTAKDAGALPDLAAMKIGRTIWLEDGTAVEPAKQAA